MLDRRLLQFQAVFIIKTSEDIASISFPLYYNLQLPRNVFMLMILSLHELQPHDIFSIVSKIWNSVPCASMWLVIMQYLWNFRTILLAYMMILTQNRGS